MKNHPWTMSDTQIIWRLLDDPDIRGLKVSAPDLFPERTAASVYAKLRYERLAREYEGTRWRKVCPACVP